MDDRTLENNLPEFLRTTAQIVASEEISSEEKVFKENIAASRLHGQSRAEIPTYTLDQVISELRILRALIFNVLEVYGTLPPIERDKIYFAIDNGITQAATEFSVLRGLPSARLSEEISAKSYAINESIKLRDSVGKLEHESKRRERLVSTVTHDIRNPLAIAKPVPK